MALSTHPRARTDKRQPAAKSSGSKVQPGGQQAALQRALNDPGAASPAALRALQHSLGNRAVSQLVDSSGGDPHPIQAKLEVGPAGDAYEQEADRVALQVMRAPAQQPATPSTQAAEAVQRKPLGQTITPFVQRAADEIDEDEQEGLAQRRAAPGAGAAFEAGAEVEGRLAANRGGGRPLAEDTRGFMEAGFGADFGGVRVHTGGEAVQLNRDLSAKAFTHGTDIYFGAGNYQPGTHGGNRLLAHELTHVVQQTQGVGAVQPKRIQRVANDLDGFDLDQFAQNQEEEANAPPQGQEDLPMFMRLLKWGFYDKPKNAYQYGRNKGWGKGRSGALAAGEGAVTGTASLLGAGGLLAAGLASVPLGIGGGLLGLAGRGTEKLTNYATGDTDTPHNFMTGSTKENVKAGAGYIGKGLMSPLTMLGLGVGAAGRGVERLGNYTRGKEDTPVNWAGLSKGQKAKQAMKYIGLGLISPAVLPFLGLGALGRKLGVGKKVKDYKKDWFDPSEQHQKEGFAGAGMVGTGYGISGGLGGASQIVSGMAGGKDYTDIPEKLRQADPALSQRPGSEGMMSQTGAGFGAVGGILAGLGGLVGVGSGLRGLFKERGKKKLTRGAGRLTAGLGQTFAGTAMAGKSISALAGATSGAAQFLTTAALPAQVAMSAVDFVKGGYMGTKAFSRHRNLAKLAGKESIANDPGKLELAEFAKEYMVKRGRNAGLNMLSGALGIAGGALMLSGFGAVAGVPLLAAAAAVKLGTLVGPTIRDKFMDKWKGKAFDGQTYSERKRGRENRMAEYAAKNWGRSDVQDILKAMGLEQKNFDKFKEMSFEEIKAKMLVLFFRR